MRIADEMGIPEDKRDSLYYALLLKDIGHGCNAGKLPPVPGQNLSSMFFHIDPQRVSFEKSRHCLQIPSDRSAEIAAKLGLGPCVAEAIRSVDECWDGRGPQMLRGSEIPFAGRICAVGQYLDLVATGRGTAAALASLADRSGRRFDPKIVRAVLSLAARDALWPLALSTDDDRLTRQAVLELDTVRQRLDPDRVDRVCEAFADVVDAKSHFTFRHSLVVADAAEAIAVKFGIPADRQLLVRRAGLLHDLGKLSVSNRILDKKDWLNAHEWAIVHQHPGLTRQILERVEPFQELAIIAGEHHEKLDGSGYPNRLRAEDLSLESRIIVVADIYGALSEDRPYRPGVTRNEIISILMKLTPHQLDVDCVGALLELLCDEQEVEFEPLPTVIKPAPKPLAIGQFCA
jgi:putative nucleotidyltransferase with HDIG domain